MHFISFHSILFHSLIIIQLYSISFSYELPNEGGFPYLGSSFFLFKNVSTLLCLSKDKTKGQSSKNTTLTPNKTLPKK